MNRKWARIKMAQNANCQAAMVGVLRANRKPSPRKLEPHEVIAKLKARKTGAPA